MSFEVNSEAGAIVYQTKESLTVAKWIGLAGFAAFQVPIASSSHAGMALADQGRCRSAALSLIPQCIPAFESDTVCEE